MPDNWTARHLEESTRASSAAGSSAGMVSDTPGSVSPGGLQAYSDQCIVVNLMASPLTWQTQCLQCEPRRRAGSGRGMSTYCRSLSSMSDPRCSGCTNSAVRDRYSFSVNSRERGVHCYGHLLQPGNDRNHECIHVSPDRKGVGSAHEIDTFLDADVASMTWLMRCQPNHSLGSNPSLGKPSLMGRSHVQRPWSKDAKGLRSNRQDSTDSRFS